MNLMKKTYTVIAAMTLAALTLSSCGNTVRGVGKDLEGTVDATQDAGNRVDRAAKY
jgi:entericidin B